MLVFETSTFPNEDQKGEEEPGLPEQEGSLGQLSPHSV